VVTAVDAAQVDATQVDRSAHREYIGGMKVKTSVTLSEEVLEAIDQQAGPTKNRSDFIEKAVRAYIAQRLRDTQNAHDLEIINRRAARLNEEAADVLSYQVVP
jgi:Arc/MetJ-type ribon-helix-helix transcriptional regulator